jgi:hypothetical protein
MVAAFKARIGRPALWLLLADHPLITLGKPATDTEQIEQLVDAAEGRAPKIQKKG